MAQRTPPAVQPAPFSRQLLEEWEEHAGSFAWYTQVYDISYLHRLVLCFIFSSFLEAAILLLTIKWEVKRGTYHFTRVTECHVYNKGTCVVKFCQAFICQLQHKHKISSHPGQVSLMALWKNFNAVCIHWIWIECVYEDRVIFTLS